MTKAELERKLREFVQSQDHSRENEWWCTSRELVAGVINDLAAHLKLKLKIEVPDALEARK